MTDLLGPAGVQTTIIAEIAANRAVIEQVKGILMIVYRIDADAAFDLPCRRRTP
jgi:AmiR/NasT family two-component response regulator